MRIFPARTRSEAGYTLFEVLVVVALIAMITATGPTIYAQVFPSFQVRQYANSVATTLRSHRAQARSGGVAVSLAYSSEARVIIDPSGQVNTPEGLEVTFEPSGPWRGDPNAGITFFPDGAAEGGTFKISRDAIEVEVVIDWISGAVEVQQ